MSSRICSGHSLQPLQLLVQRNGVAPAAGRHVAAASSFHSCRASGAAPIAAVAANCRSAAGNAHSCDSVAAGHSPALGFRSQSLARCQLRDSKQLTACK